MIGEKAEAAASAVGDMANRTATNLSAEADDLASIAGRGVQRFGEQLRRNTPQSGMLGSVSKSVARTVTEGGEYMECSKLSGMRHDLATLIRSNPVPTIFIAIGLGWIASRMTRK
ncbi:MAG: hypothetical protein NTV29_19580 [Planctomycetota bacterium]|nr:hypothetical protein [Planctomycetota bacterium]